MTISLRRISRITTDIPVSASFETDYPGYAAYAHWHLCMLNTVTALECSNESTTGMTVIWITGSSFKLHYFWAAPTAGAQAVVSLNRVFLAGAATSPARSSLQITVGGRQRLQSHRMERCWLVEQEESWPRGS